MNALDSLLAAALVAIFLGPVPVLPAAAGPPASPATVPPLDLREEGPERHLAWVSLEAAVDPEGEVRWDLFSTIFPEQLRQRLDFVAKRLEADPDLDPLEICTVTVTSGGPRPDSLGTLVEEALAIVRGRVVALEQGFAGERPATLLTIEVEERLRFHPSYSGSDYLYLIYVHGRFDFAGTPLCNWGGGFEHPPAVGDRLLVLPRREPMDPEGRVISAPGEAVFVETGDGVTVNDRLRDHDELRELPDLAALEALIRAKIAGDPAAEPFDREACTPPALAEWNRYGSLGPYDRSWSDRHWSADCTQILVIDLEGDVHPGIAGPEHAVRFDVDGDGAPETTSWPYATEAMPWLDLDRNGAVDGAHELFSVHTRRPDGVVGPTALEALAAFDEAALGGDADGAITERDLVWNDLKLWVDLDHDGRSRAGEVFRPDDVCLVRLSLDADRERRHDGQGHRIWSTAEALRRDARGKPLRGVMFEISPKREIE